MGQFFLCDLYACRNAWQNQIEDGGFGIHDTTRQAKNGCSVFKIGQQEHSSRKYRCTVGYDSCTGIFNSTRCPVIRIHAHTAGAENEIGSFFLQLQNRIGNALHIVVTENLSTDFDAVGCQFFNNNRSEGILDSSIINFISGGNDARFHWFKGSQGNQRFFTCCLFDPFHFLFCNDQRNDAGTKKTVSFFHCCIGMPGGNHHLVNLIDRIQPRHIHPKQTIAVCHQFDLSFFYIRWMHMIIDTDIFQDLRCLIFMESVFILLPYIEVILSEGQQNRNILLCHNMSFPKCRVLYHILHNSCNIMAEHMTYCIRCINTFHDYFLRTFFLYQCITEQIKKATLFS